MTKTIIISDDVHLLIVKKQIHIREKYGIYLRITDIVSIGMKDALGRIEELFNLKVEEQKSDASKTDIIENTGTKTNNNRLNVQIIEETEVKR